MRIKSNNNSNSSNNNQSNDNPKFNIETDIDEELTLDDIKKDIAKINKMLKRTDNRINVYQNQLKLLLQGSKRDKSLLEKGLEFFKLKKKINTKV